MTHQTIHLRSTIQLLALSGIVFFLGCSTQNQLPTEYGQVSGRTGTTSLNGVSVFHDMFAQQGFRVKRRRKISPMIRKFQTIVWFPDSDNCPNENTIDALSEWFAKGYSRTLIYVGRDYEAQLDYLQKIFEQVPNEQKEELLRIRAESMISRKRRSTDRYGYLYRRDDLQSCKWFQILEGDQKLATDFSGPLANQIDMSKSQISIGNRIEPSNKINKNSGFEFLTLLSANGKEFVWEMSHSQNDMRLIVVSNGSFLLNYSLVNPAHQQLAERLINRTQPKSNVLFLESGPAGIPVSESDYENRNSWAWIAEPPLRYIVPHLLMWGIIFCFVCFPIFGRPKNIFRRNLSQFRNHLRATAKLLQQTQTREDALRKISEFQSQHGEKEL